MAKRLLRGWCWKSLTTQQPWNGCLTKPWVRGVSKSVENGRTPEGAVATLEKLQAAGPRPRARRHPGWRPARPRGSASPGSNSGWPQLANSVGQGLQIVWLLENRETLENSFLRPLAVTCREQYRNLRMISAHDPGKLETGHAARHENICNDEMVWPLALKISQSFRC